MRAVPQSHSPCSKSRQTLLYLRLVPAVTDRKIARIISRGWGRIVRNSTLSNTVIMSFKWKAGGQRRSPRRSPRPSRLQGIHLIFIYWQRTLWERSGFVEFKSPSSGEEGVLSSQFQGQRAQSRAEGSISGLRAVWSPCTCLWTSVFQEGSVCGHGNADFLEIPCVMRRFSCDF